MKDEPKQSHPAPLLSERQGQRPMDLTCLDTCLLLVGHQATNLFKPCQFLPHVFVMGEIL